MLNVTPEVAQDTLHYVPDLARSERSQLGTIVMHAESDALVAETEQAVAAKKVEPYSSGALRIMDERDLNSLGSGSSATLEDITVQLSRLARGGTAVLNRSPKR